MGQSDCLTFYTTHLGLVALNIQPCVILIGVQYQPQPIVNTDDPRVYSPMEKVIFSLCCAQSLLLLVGLFITTRIRNTYREYERMPEIKRALMYVSQLVFPVIIFIFSLWSMLKVPKEKGVSKFDTGAEFFFIMNI